MYLYKAFYNVEKAYLQFPQSLHCTHIFYLCCFNAQPILAFFLRILYIFNVPSAIHSIHRIRLFLLIYFLFAVVLLLFASIFVKYLCLCLPLNIDSAFNMYFIYSKMIDSKRHFFLLYRSLLLLFARKMITKKKQLRQKHIHTYQNEFQVNSIYWNFVWAFPSIFYNHLLILLRHVTRTRKMVNTNKGNSWNVLDA